MLSLTLFIRIKATCLDNYSLEYIYLTVIIISTIKGMGMTNRNRIDQESKESQDTALNSLISEMQPFINTIPTLNYSEPVKNLAQRVKIYASIMGASISLIVVAGIFGSLNDGKIPLSLLGVAGILFVIGTTLISSLIYASCDDEKVDRFFSWSKFALSSVERHIALKNKDSSTMFKEDMKNHKKLTKEKIEEMKPIIDLHNNNSSKWKVYISDLGYVKLRRD